MFLRQNSFYAFSARFFRTGNAINDFYQISHIAFYTAMDNLTIFTISHSPHSHVRIERRLKVGELKRIIITDYNEGNPEDITQVQIVGYEKAGEDEDIKSFFVECINGNIYKRLDSGIISAPLPELSCALFNYEEFDETRQKQNPMKIFYPSRPTSEVLPFFIINKTAKGDINIRLFEPKQMNWGFGPTLPQLYYQLGVDGKLNIYNVDVQPDNTITTKDKTYRFKDRDERIVNNVDSELLKSAGYHRPISWTLAGECQVCYERPINAIFLGCKHCVACTMCAVSLKACTRCTKPVREFVICIDPPSYEPVSSSSGEHTDH